MKPYQSAFFLVIFIINTAHIAMIGVVYLTNVEIDIIDVAMLQLMSMIGGTLISGVIFHVTSTYFRWEDTA